jgi:nucleotide-binding universal stress UspA family protein
MKILVCTDGSKNSEKVMEKAAEIVKTMGIDRLSLIYVYDAKLVLSYIDWNQNLLISPNFETLRKELLELSHEILDKGVEFLEKKEIKVKKIFKEGHASSEIVHTIEEEGFDMVIIGNRGLGGLKKLVLGSVSNAVVQEVENCNVLIVK